MNDTKRRTRGFQSCCCTSLALWRSISKAGSYLHGARPLQSTMRGTHTWLLPRSPWEWQRWLLAAMWALALPLPAVPLLSRRSLAILARLNVSVSILLSLRSVSLQAAHAGADFVDASMHQHTQHALACRSREV